VHVLIAAGATNGWSQGAAILTFAFPMILFIAVASTLYVLYTKPHLVPGHRYHMAGSSAVSTAPVTSPVAPQVASPVGPQPGGEEETGGTGGETGGTGGLES